MSKFLQYRATLSSSNSSEAQDEVNTEMINAQLALTSQDSQSIDGLNLISNIEKVLQLLDSVNSKSL